MVVSSEGRTTDRGVQRQLWSRIVEAETEGGGGEQDVEFDVDDCEISYDGESQDTDCEDIDDGEWDGEDTITFEASLGSTDCDGELERDD